MLSHPIPKCPKTHEHGIPTSGCRHRGHKQHNPELEEVSSSRQLWAQWCDHLEEGKTVADQQYFHKTVIPSIGPGYSMLHIIWCSHSMEAKDFLNCRSTVPTSSRAEPTHRQGSGFVVMDEHTIFRLSKKKIYESKHYHDLVMSVFTLAVGWSPFTQKTPKSWLCCVCHVLSHYSHCLLGFASCPTVTLKQKPLL